MMTFLIYNCQRSLGRCKNLIFFFIKKNSLPIAQTQKFHKDFTINTESSDNDKSKIELPEEPQNCCMSGCANCVWIDYAEKLAEIFQDGGEAARQKINEHVKDPNLRAFIMMELDDLFKEKKKK